MSGFLPALIDFISAKFFEIINGSNSFTEKMLFLRLRRLKQLHQYQYYYHLESTCSAILFEAKINFICFF